MPTRSVSLETEALSLPLRRRTKLIVKLLDSIEKCRSGDPGRVQRAWLEEANRRYEAYRRGEDEAVPAEQAFAELRAEKH